MRRFYADSRPVDRAWLREYHLYRMTSITRGRAVVTYVGKPIGTVVELPTGYWRAAPIGRRAFAQLYDTRRGAKDALIRRHMEGRLGAEAHRGRARGAH
jgi:hypothetical protein